MFPDKLALGVKGDNAAARRIISRGSLGCPVDGLGCVYLIGLQEWPQWDGASSTLEFMESDDTVI